jgi:lipid II:glycine glycyltransferase (peptidoglycan interpeptide bridge formation enzyme)
MRLKIFIIITLLITTALLLYLLFLKPKCTCFDAVQTIETKNDSLAKEKLLLDEMIRKMQYHADSLTEKMQQRKQTVLTLKKNQHEKLQSIDHFTHNELADFFARIKTDSTADAK